MFLIRILYWVGMVFRRYVSFLFLLHSAIQLRQSLAMHSMEEKEMHAPAHHTYNVMELMRWCYWTTLTQFLFIIRLWTVERIQLLNAQMFTIRTLAQIYSTHCTAVDVDYIRLFFSFLRLCVRKSVCY